MTYLAYDDTSVSSSWFFFHKRALQWSWCNVTVMVHWRRFAPVVPTLILVTAMSFCSFNVNCLFMYDSYGWPFSLISHQHQHILRYYLIAGWLADDIFLKQFCFHSVRTVFTSPKFTVNKLKGQSRLVLAQESADLHKDHWCHHVNIWWCFKQLADDIITVSLLWRHLIVM